MSALFKDPRIGCEFQSAEEVESLPVGAVLIDSEGDAWQRAQGRSWFCPGAPEVGDFDLAVGFAPLLLVWIPPGSELKPEPVRAAYVGRRRQVVAP